MSKVKFEEMDRHLIAYIGITIGLLFGFFIGVCAVWIVESF
jgi:hypothetical protein